MYVESVNVVAMVKVYVLIDPRTNEIRYVGKTKNSLTKRLSQHMDDVRKGERNWRSNWIASLRRLGYRPMIELVQEIPSGDWEKAESYWIGYYRSVGCKLTNGTSGGDGGYSPTLEVRAKCGTANIGNTYRKGKTHTAETRAKLSAATKRQLSDPARMKVMREYRLGTHDSPETIARKSKAQLIRNQDPIEWAKHGLSMKGRPKTPEAISNMAAAQQARRERERPQRGATD